MKKQLVLIGGGGHCKACIDVISTSQAFEIWGIVDLAGKIGQRVLGQEILASDDRLGTLIDPEMAFLITMGQIKSPDRRIELYAELSTSGAVMATVVSPLAHVPPSAEIGQGSIVMHQAILGPESHVGENCIINTRAVVEHDAVVEDHCHISTGAIVNGGAIVGRGSFIGSGAVLRQGCVVPPESIVPAGTYHRGIRPSQDQA